MAKITSIYTVIVISCLLISILQWLFILLRMKAYKSFPKPTRPCTIWSLLPMRSFITSPFKKCQCYLVQIHHAYSDQKALTFTVFCLEYTSFTPYSYAYLPHFYIANPYFDIVAHSSQDYLIFSYSALFFCEAVLFSNSCISLLSLSPKSVSI